MSSLTDDRAGKSKPKKKAKLAPPTPTAQLELGIDPNIGSDLLEVLANSKRSYDLDKIRRAVAFCVKAHGEQKRASGEPYFTHPIAIAKILANYKLDTDTIITALLHDTVEDTPATFEDLEREFGITVRNLVDGTTKLAKIKFYSDNTRQAENFRKLLIAISEDIRVLMVKLVDRLHNMRTLSYLPKPEKRQRIARETMDIYAPLAERIGMRKVQEELEDIAFRELQPEAYQSVMSRLEYLRETGTVQVEELRSNMEKLLQESGIEARVSGREKKPYSIWRKMQRKNITFEQLADIVAFRVVVKNLPDCYRALGIIHSGYPMVPESFKDYISTPKQNGYQSLHTVVIGPNQTRLEVQIRSRTMNQVAEKGVAAHWAYKQQADYSTDGKQFRWIRELLTILEQSDQPEEFLEHTKLEMYHDQVFCFTPKGDLIALPHNATPVDFAFAVHSEVGRTCVGAKVNGKIVPLRSQLKNGDQVEIIRSKSQQPSPMWENFVVTGKARSEIRRFVRMQQRDEYISLGREILSKAAQNIGEDLKEKPLKKVSEDLNKKSIEDLYESLGEGSVKQQDVLTILFPEKMAEQHQRFEEKQRGTLLDRFRRFTHGKKDEHEKQRASIPINGLIPGMAIHFAGCCHPLPGEKIVGIVNSGRGVTIHTSQCVELQQFVNEPDRWLDVSWQDGGQEMYVGRLRALLSHEKGSLGTLANVIASHEGNINNLRIEHRSPEYFEMIVDVEVRNIDHLNIIMGVLRSKAHIREVERYDG